jgi:hypothetical protein
MFSRTAMSRRTRTALVALICTLCLHAKAFAEAPRVLVVPPGELSTALEIVAKQSGVELLFLPEQMKGIHTNGVAGMLTAQQAAEALLAGTQFQLRTDPTNGAMMIGLAPDASEPPPQAGAGGAVLTPRQQVEVSARRARLGVMRGEMVKLEDSFYTEYNRLNADHQWDVSCDLEAPTGSHIKLRVCRPRFVDDAMATVLHGGGTVTSGRTMESGQYMPNREAPITIILRKWPEYEKNMLRQINGHPHLRRLVNEREAMGKRYEAARRQKLEGKIVVLD